jgi:hypothetical protein
VGLGAADPAGARLRDDRRSSGAVSAAIITPLVGATAIGTENAVPWAAALALVAGAIDAIGGPEHVFHPVKEAVSRIDAAAVRLGS